MLNAKSLLDSVLNAGKGLASGQGLNAGQQGGFDVNRLLEGKGGLATGAVAGGLLGLLMGGKDMRRFAGGALQMGGAAVIGGLAYKAWQDWQANKEPVAPGAAPAALPSPQGTVFLPADAAAADDLSTKVLRAMVAAAKADGHVTEAERANIASGLRNIGLGDEARALIEEELARPLDAGAVAAMATSPEVAAELYAASLLALDEEGAAEKGYLALLAARLKLDPRLVEHLHANAKALTV